MKVGVHIIVAAIMFGLAIYTSEFLNDICGTVINCSAGLFNVILAVTWIIIEKIDSHENKITKETEKKSKR